MLARLQCDSAEDNPAWRGTVWAAGRLNPGVARPEVTAQDEQKRRRRQPGLEISAKRARNRMGAIMTEAGAQAQCGAPASCAGLAAAAAKGLFAARTA